MGRYCSPGNCFVCEMIWFLDLNGYVEASFINKVAKYSMLMT